MTATPPPDPADRWLAHTTPTLIGVLRWIAAHPDAAARQGLPALATVRDTIIRRECGAAAPDPDWPVAAAAPAPAFPLGTVPLAGLLDLVEAAGRRRPLPPGVDAELIWTEVKRRAEATNAYAGTEGDEPMPNPKDQTTVTDHASAERARARLIEIDRDDQRPNAAEADALRAEIDAWQAAEQQREVAEITTAADHLAATIEAAYRRRADALTAMRRIDGALLDLRQRAEQLRRRAASAGVAVTLPTPIVDSAREAADPEAAGAFYLYQRGLGPVPTLPVDPLLAGHRAASEIISALRRSDRAAGIPVSGPKLIDRPTIGGQP